MSRALSALILLLTLGGCSLRGELETSETAEDVRLTEDSQLSEVPGTPAARLRRQRVHPGERTDGAGR